MRTYQRSAATSSCTQSASERNRERPQQQRTPSNAMCSAGVSQALVNHRAASTLRGPRPRQASLTGAPRHGEESECLWA